MAFQKFTQNTAIKVIVFVIILPIIIANALLALLGDGIGAAMISLILAPLIIGIFIALASLYMKRRVQKTSVVHRENSTVTRILSLIGLLAGLVVIGWIVFWIIIPLLSIPGEYKDMKQRSEETTKRNAAIARGCVDPYNFYKAQSGLSRLTAAYKRSLEIKDPEFVEKLDQEWYQTGIDCIENIITTEQQAVLRQDIEKRLEDRLRELTSDEFMSSLRDQYGEPE